ncbi:surface-anchored 5'-nucleotidase [Streptococcus halichoeri]|uniref:surface-anchored 5'-nucleotidase n=1 Tax=Streptococcus halichoeri TaxID=254785 RepID=UPI001C8EEB64|nr:bifunctional metallophosphatase/5'-nucleotidase [Streptococcus halichoeri]
MKKHLVLKSSILGFAASLSVLTGAAHADQVDVQLLGVNDFHGALDQTGTASMPDAKVAGAGSAAQLDAYMDKAETDFKSTSPNGTSIRVQAGDMVGASPANSALLQDEPTVKVFSQMDFKYGTLGNHEFDEGLAEYHRIMTGTAPAADSSINTITKSYDHQAAKQQIVIANVIDKATNQIPYNWQPYAIETIPVNNTSAKIGFIGVVTSEIPDLVLKQNHENYTFLDEAETIVHYAKMLRAQNVNAIVVLAHIPATSNKEGQVGDQVAMIMNKVNHIYPDNSVDVVFAGHNHQYTNGTIGTTRVVQALSQGKAYADVRGRLDTDTQDFITTPSATVTAVAPKILAGSAEVQAIVDQANAIVAQVTNDKIGTAATSASISREVNQDMESAVGDLITRAQLMAARDSYPDVDFAFTNNGGIRADLVVTDNQTITWGAAQAVQPFGNILQVVEMSGQDIYNVLNEQYNENQRYFLQMAGLRYTYTDNPAGDSTTPFKVVKAYKENGQEIIPSQTYKVVINDFLFGGGDGFASFRKATLHGAIKPDTEVFINYIKDQEAAGKKISSRLAGTKTYVKITVEGSQTSDANGKHDTMTRIFRDCTGQIVGTEPISELFTPKADHKLQVSQPAQSLATPQTKSLSPMARANQAAVTSQATLPKTGSKQGNVLWTSLLGLLSLGFAAQLKKKTKA